MRIDWIGLGAMGGPMTARLAAAGHQVRGLDRDPAAQQRWEQEHGVPPGPADAVLVCVSDEAASRAVLAALLCTAAAGTLVVDHTTTSPDWAREAAARCRAAGLHWCDAPLSGGVEGAQRGELVALLGAEDADLAAVRELLAPTTRAAVHLGPPGSGQLGKLANQLAIAGIAAGLADAQDVARAGGLDLERLFGALLQGSARSVQLERLHATLAQPGNRAARTYAWLAKDLAPCADRPLARLWQQRWKDEQR